VVFTFQWGPFSRLGSDIPAFWQSVVWCGVFGCRGGAWFRGLSCVRACFGLVVAAVLVVTGAGLVVAAAAWSRWPGGEAGEGFAAPFAGFRG